MSKQGDESILHRWGIAISVNRNLREHMGFILVIALFNKVLSKSKLTLGTDANSTWSISERINIIILKYILTCYR